MQSTKNLMLCRIPRAFDDGLAFLAIEREWHRDQRF
jgi:hypothetical protein